MTTLISNIRTLVNVRDTFQPLRGSALSHLPCIDDAYIVIENDRIAEYGTTQSLKFKAADFNDHFDATGRLVLPAWCDNHTHLVFSGSRENEFVDKIRGCTYAEIAARGGGILASAAKVNAASEDELFQQAYRRLKEVVSMGTGALEIKSGYGLSVEGELKMLRVIKRLKQSSVIPIKASFLGAHTVPPAYKENREGYIHLIIDEMLPAVANEKLADFIDVFCENGFFTPDETERICLAGSNYGLKPKIHAN